MKKFAPLAVIMVMALILFGSANIVKADTIEMKVQVTYDPATNKVAFVGPEANRIDTVVQFCDWEHRKKCAKNVYIKRGADGKFQLDAGGLSHNQTDFNAKVGNLWLDFAAGPPDPSDLVTVGPGLEITDSPEGARIHVKR